MLLETLIGSIVGGILCTIIGTYLWERKLRDHISVIRIKDPNNDKNIEGLIELYADLFPDETTNYSCEEILELVFAFPENRHTKVENIVLVAKFRNDVVGFLFCHFYPDRRKAIISYIGIDKQILEARHKASRKMYKKLKTILMSHGRICNFLFFDIQGIDSSLPQEERTRRKARVTLFKQTAESFGFHAYKFQFDYQCPKVELTENTNEYPFTLLCIPISDKISSPVSKKTILDFLNFVYLDCYGDIYPITDPKFKLYHSYLDEKLKYYEKSLPNYINVD